MIEYRGDEVIVCMARDTVLIKLLDVIVCMTVGTVAMSKTSPAAQGLRVVSLFQLVAVETSNRGVLALQSEAGSTVIKGRDLPAVDLMTRSAVLLELPGVDIDVTVVAGGEVQSTKDGRRTCRCPRRRPVAGNTCYIAMLSPQGKPRLLVIDRCLLKAFHIVARGAILLKLSGVWICVAVGARRESHGPIGNH